MMSTKNESLSLPSIPLSLPGLINEMVDSLNKASPVIREIYELWKTALSAKDRHSVINICREVIAKCENICNNYPPTSIDVTSCYGILILVHFHISKHYNESEVGNRSVNELNQCLEHALLSQSYIEKLPLEKRYKYEEIKSQLDFIEGNVYIKMLARNKFLPSAKDEQYRKFMTKFEKLAQNDNASFELLVGSMHRLEKKYGEALLYLWRSHFHGEAVAYSKINKIRLNFEVNKVFLMCKLAKLQYYQLELEHSLSQDELNKDHLLRTVNEFFNNVILIFQDNKHPGISSLTKSTFTQMKAIFDKTSDKKLVGLIEDMIKWINDVSADFGPETREVARSVVTIFGEKIVNEFTMIQSKSEWHSYFNAIREFEKRNLFDATIFHYQILLQAIPLKDEYKPMIGMTFHRLGVELLKQSHGNIDERARAVEYLLEASSAGIDLTEINDTEIHLILAKKFKNQADSLSHQAKTTRSAKERIQSNAKANTEYKKAVAHYLSICPDCNSENDFQDLMSCAMSMTDVKSLDMLISNFEMRLKNQVSVNADKMLGYLNKNLDNTSFVPSVKRNDCKNLMLKLKSMLSPYAVNISSASIKLEKVETPIKKAPDRSHSIKNNKDEKSKSKKQQAQKNTKKKSKKKVKDNAQQKKQNVQPVSKTTKIPTLVVAKEPESKVQSSIQHEMKNESGQSVATVKSNKKSKRQKTKKTGLTLLDRLNKEDEKVSSKPRSSLMTDNIINNVKAEPGTEKEESRADSWLGNLKLLSPDQYGLNAINLTPWVIEVMTRLKERGYPSFWKSGELRHQLLFGEKVYRLRDTDIVTPAPIEIIEDVFGKRDNKHGHANLCRYYHFSQYNVVVDIMHIDAKNLEQEILTNGDFTLREFCVDIEGNLYSIDESYLKHLADCVLVTVNDLDVVIKQDAMRIMDAMKLIIEFAELGRTLTPSFSKEQLIEFYPLLNNEALQGRLSQKLVDLFINGRSTQSLKILQEYSLLSTLFPDLPADKKVMTWLGSKVQMCGMSCEGMNAKEIKQFLFAPFIAASIKMIDADDALGTILNIIHHSSLLKAVFSEYDHHIINQICGLFKDKVLQTFTVMNFDANPYHSKNSQQTKSSNETQVRSQSNSMERFGLFSLPEPRLNAHRGGVGMNPGNSVKPKGV